MSAKLWQKLCIFKLFSINYIYFICFFHVCSSEVKQWLEDNDNYEKVKDVFDSTSR